MKRLTILRHAKSSWDDRSLDDFDRPLNERGWKAARRMGREISKRGMKFDFVLASTAARVRQTIDGLGEDYRLEAPIRFEPRIYMARASELLELVAAIPQEAESALLVGHNTAVERLVIKLSSDDEEGLRARVQEKFPTAALAAIELPIERWNDVEPNIGQVVELIFPKELD